MRGRKRLTSRERVGKEKMIRNEREDMEIIINQTMSRTKEINVRMMTVIPTEN